MFRKEKVELPESAYWALLVYFLAIGGLTVTGADTADMVDLFKRIGLDGNGILTLIGIYVAYVLVRRQLNQVDTNLMNHNRISISWLTQVVRRNVVDRK